MKNDNALFYTCSLIEYIGRQQKLSIGLIYQWPNLTMWESAGIKSRIIGQ